MVTSYAEKLQKNKSGPRSVSSPQKKFSGPTSQISSHNPNSIDLANQQKLANDSFKSGQLAQLQAIEETSSQTRQLRQFGEIANSSPHASQTAQLRAMADNNSAQKSRSLPKKQNNTGLPENLKTGIENLSGMSLDDVKVHRNSDKPAQLNAHAYAQGSDIHLASGQEKHLPHEAWHTVQQKQGRVKPTVQARGIAINNDTALEKESDVMGREASINHKLIGEKKGNSTHQGSQTGIIQRKPLGIYSDPPKNEFELDTSNIEVITNYITTNEQNDRQDLNRLLVEAVRRKDHANLSRVQTIAKQHETDTSKQAVPNVIHMIWIGDRIGSGEVKNIERIHASINDKAGWKIILWTDSRKCGFLGESEEIKNLSKKNNFEVNKTLEKHVDKRVQPTYEIAYGKTSEGEKGAFTMMSDLARYSILLSQGGIYMDVDLNLGHADVSKWDMEMSADHGLPAFGPNIQYVDDMESNLPPDLTRLSSFGNLKAQSELKEDLRKGTRQAFQKMFEFRLEDETHENVSDQAIESAKTMDVMSSDETYSDKTRIAAMAQYMRGNFSNNLVAAPKNQKFLNFMIADISRRLADKGNDFDPGMVAQITGPAQLMPIIMRFYGDQGVKVSSDSETKRALIDPNWVSQLIQVEWLTHVQKSKKERANAEQVEQAPSRGCCYITTACVTHMGLTDECEELTILRQFRDDYLLKKSNGRRLFDLYYKHSPAIVSAIHQRDDEEEILERLYGIIKECVEEIKNGNSEFAFQTYCDMVIELKEEFIPETKISVSDY